MKIEELVNFIKNGVNINGKTRNFDILDYYILSKGVPVKVFLENLPKDISLDNLKTLKTFFFNNNEGTLMDIDSYYIRQILSTKDEVNTKRNEEGYPIPGTGRIIKTEEKRNIIDYIINNNIPLTTKIYSLAMKRYISGELIIEDTKHVGL